MVSTNEEYATKRMMRNRVTRFLGTANIDAIDYLNSLILTKVKDWPIPSIHIVSSKGRILRISFFIHFSNSLG